MTGAAPAAPLTTQPPEPEPGPPGLSPGELARWAWRQLTSMRTALVLLMLLAVGSVPGSLIPQDRVDARAVTMWKASHPTLSPVFGWLGLFHVYGSVWFSAIYMLLMVSIIGCILPRLRVYAHAATAPPPAAPRNLARLPAYADGTLRSGPTVVAEAAERVLRRGRHRVRVARAGGDGSVTVSAQRGYLREAGNLLFHCSVVIVLVAFAIGDLFGYRGGVIVMSGQTFTNVRESYDDYAPGAFFRNAALPPFDLKLDNFAASFLTSGPQLGQPTSFSADLVYRNAPGASTRRTALRVNHPLTIAGTNVFLVGNGYAPIITVRDGAGKIVYSGPTVFLPQDSSYASWGVVKVPDARPTQLGFEGLFLPTYGYDKTRGPYSRFPDALAPALSLSAYRGDLGLGSGLPQSVYALTKSGLTPVNDQTGKPVTLTIPLGQTRRLPGGVGSISFDGVRRWAKLQLSSTPAEPLALGAVLVGLLGLVTSLYTRPRRLWVRVRPAESGAHVEIGGLDRTGHSGIDAAVRKLMDDIRKATA